MKLATVLWENSTSAVWVEGIQASLVRTLPDRRAATDVLALIRDPLRPDELELLRQQGQPLAELTLLPPILHPPKHLLCVGKNYADHVQEGAKALGTATELPTVPIWFTKPPSALVGCGADILRDPAFSEQLDYEGELVAVIGRQGKGIPVESALDYVFGYTLLNDVTARDVQQRHRQWFKGKSADTFAPCGPVIVTADAIPDYRALRIQTHVDGELRQNSSLDQLIFDLPTLIADLSQGITLEPGDLIATGTPAGVGWGMDPPRFLQPGNHIEITIAEIGTLWNRVIGP